MVFAIGDISVRADVIEEELFLSKSSGRQLHRRRIEFHTRPGKNADVLSNAGPDAELIEETGDSQVVWRKGRSSSKYSTDNERSWTFNWYVEQVERLTPDSVVAGPLALLPQIGKYHEEWRGERLEIVLVADVDGETHERVLDLIASQETVGVVRKGLSDIERQMTLEKSPWAKTDSAYRWLLRLQDAPRDDRPIAGFLPMGRAINTVPYLMEAFDELGSLLSSKGILSEVEFAELKERAEAGHERRAVRMLEVDEERLQRFWDSESRD